MLSPSQVATCTDCSQGFKSVCKCDVIFSNRFISIIPQLEPIEPIRIMCWSNSLSLLVMHSACWHLQVSRSYFHIISLGQGDMAWICRVFPTALPCICSKVFHGIKIRKTNTQSIVTQDSILGFCCCSVTKSCPTLVTPWTAAGQASLSFTVSQSLLKFMSIESVMPSNHLILCCSLFLLPSIFPRVRVFSDELALHIRWPKYWSFNQHQSFQWVFRVNFL